MQDLEAKIVKYIYSIFLQGINPKAIVKELEDKEVKNVRELIKWYGSTIKSMLQMKNIQVMLFFKKHIQLIS